jgi:hypothetical protein
LGLQKFMYSIYEKKYNSYLTEDLQRSTPYDVEIRTGVAQFLCVVTLKIDLQTMQMRFIKGCAGGQSIHASVQASANAHPTFPNE